ncbi:hypothetical protein N9J05_00680 [bacterium]|nr:hypothetical protein [bacterium]
MLKIKQNKKILFLSLALLFSANVFSQNVDSYMKKAATEKVYKLIMVDPSINFYDILLMNAILEMKIGTG